MKIEDRMGQQIGNYNLIRLLGQGGFAEVYLGEHIYLKTQAAIKVLHTQLASSEIQSFLVEARTIAHLEHPHIVRVLEFAIERNTPFLVMSYAPNGSLRQRHPKGTRLTLDFILQYTRQVADALQYAHTEKLIHRDIKPENMLLDRRNEVLLSDFGIATIAHSSRSQSIQEVAGTAAYIAPEQLQGKPSPASDQYALGIVVYEWLSGDRPFQGTLNELYSQHLHVPPPPLSEKVPGIPYAIEQVVLKALEKDPQKRFVTVQAFATALEKACQSTLPSTSAQPFAETPSSALPKTITVTPPPGQLPQPTVLAPPPPQPTAVVPLPNQSPKRTVAANSSIKPLPTTIQRRWRPWVVLFAFFVLVIGTTLVYFEHTFIPTGTIQSKPPASTFTSITTSTVHVYDKANVLNVSQVQSEAAKLPNNIDIYTVNNFTGSNSAFDQETAQHTANNANLIVIAIDTVHHHLAIKAGSNVRLSNSQADDARNAFINNFQNGDSTGATIAAIHSLQNSLK